MNMELDVEQNTREIRWLDTGGGFFDLKARTFVTAKKLLISGPKPIFENTLSVTTCNLLFLTHHSSFSCFLLIYCYPVILRILGFQIAPHLGKYIIPGTESSLPMGFWP